MIYRIDTELTLQFFQIMASRDLEGLREFVDNIRAKNMRIISVMNSTLLMRQECEFNERFNSDNTPFYTAPEDDFFERELIWIGWMGDRVVEVVGGKDETKGD